MRVLARRRSLRPSSRGEHRVKLRVGALRGPWAHEVIRVVLLVLCGGVAVGSGQIRELSWVLPLLALGTVASRAHPGARGLLIVLAEGVLAGAAVAQTGLGGSPYLPYLIAPAFTGGLLTGPRNAVLPVAGETAAMLLSPLALESSQHFTSDLAQWEVLALLVAGVAAWMHTVWEEDHRPALLTAQIEAFRLLTELRSVARQLPGTLDPETSGEAMLDRARAVCRYDTGAVLVAQPGSQQLTVVARHGHERPHWDLSLTADSPLARAWLTQQPQSLAKRLPRTEGPAPAGSCLVLPLLSGARTFGLVVLESGVAQAFPGESPSRVAQAVDGLALQLQTGLVFDEVRELATHEERRRLSREIHDGIAQELVSLAYSLDNVAADLTTQGEVAEQVDSIRDEVRRLVTELRMSLFDLRSDVDPDEGLGAAIGRHVRTVGTATGMTVHLSLNEAPVRLGAETEAELLRIVQEAVTNARKHARASNLWVVCTVDPPYALITVEDDGQGLKEIGGAGNHGLAIMRERAARVRAELTVAPRDPVGTRLQVIVGKVRM